MQGTVTASPLVIDSLACSCAFGGAVVFFGRDISFPLNEKYRKSIGVDWLRRLADAGLFVAWKKVSRTAKTGMGFLDSLGGMRNTGWIHSHVEGLC